MKIQPCVLLCGLLLLACTPGGPRSVPAAAVAPYTGSLAITPDPLAFEDTFVGCVRNVTLRLENTGDEAPLRIVRVVSPNPGLTATLALPLEVPPGEPRFVDVHFAPTAPGPWEGFVAFETDEGDGAAYRLAATAAGLAAPERRRDPAAVEPLDLVFVLDISTTMDEMAQLRKAMQGLFDFVDSNELDVRFGLTTFENDVLVHRGAAFLDRAAFFQELDSQLVPDLWVPNPELPRQLLNYDLPENILDALYRSATDFDFRPDARRYFLLMTDDTFLEPPAVFSDGTPVLHSHAAVSAALSEHEVRLFSVHAGAKGYGLSSNHRGAPSLVQLTRGAWFELADVSSGAVKLDTLLGDLLMGPVCE